VTRLPLLVPALLLVIAACHEPPPIPGRFGDARSELADSLTPYHFVTEIQVGGDDGFWDYLTVAPQEHRLYVSHGTNIAVIDTDQDTVVGHIDSLPSVHGIALAHDLGRGFATVGRGNEVAIVDLTTLGVISRVPTGEDPDAVLYVPKTHEVYAFNGGSRSVTVIDARDGLVVATIPLPGKPEFAVWDPVTERIYDNIEDQNEIVVIDPSTHQVEKTWPVASGEAPTGLAVDPQGQRLFAVCQNGRMVMLDTSSGLLVGSVPIGRNPDGARYDPETRLAFSSNGDGTVTIAHVDNPRKLGVLQTLQTEPGARTMALDPRTHRIYLSVAEREESSDGEGGRSGQRMVPGSFKVLVYGLEGS